MNVFAALVIGLLSGVLISGIILSLLVYKILKSYLKSGTMSWVDFIDKLKHQDV